MKNVCCLLLCVGVLALACAPVCRAADDPDEQERCEAEQAEADEEAAMDAMLGPPKKSSEPNLIGELRDAARAVAAEYGPGAAIIQLQDLIEELQEAAS